MAMFKKIIDELTSKVPLALTSLTNLRNKALHECVRNHFSNRSNIFTNNSFLAEPFYEAVFPWKTSANTKADDVRNNQWHDIVGSLHEHEKLYKHQVEAVNAVQNGKSIVVTTGTGSGKTECFLYPIFNRLAKEACNVGTLSGIQALFLYPLNALIESQGDRLRKFVKKYNDDVNIPGSIRFANYTGKMVERRIDFRTKYK
mgnify:FL=1